MSTNVTVPKRRRGNRMGEPRAQDDASSRDASEEDNDDVNDASDAASILSVQALPLSNSSTAASSPRMAPPAALPSPAAPQKLAPPVSTLSAPSASNNTHSQPVPSSVLPPLTRRALKDQRIRELGNEGSASEGLDSPTYDGDVESSSTIGGTPVHHAHHQGAHHVRRPSSPTPGGPTHLAQPTAISPYGAQRVPTPKASRTNLLATSTVNFSDHSAPADVPVPPSKALAEPHRQHSQTLSAKPSSSSLGPPKMYTRPVELAESDIKAFVGRAINGQGHEDGVDRWWRTNAPEEGKVVRVYADGVYDLFHFGHALQLRQAKLSFPRVHLLVGVCSDALCASHKSAPAMTHAERCESVRHCRWADEVLADAPWIVDQAWLDKHDIDYIAHDEEVYPTKDVEDVYAFAKKTGRFVPTRRTPSISTSDLLERIVRGYRDGFFDSKLEKNGHPDLMAADVDWDSSGSVEKREKRIAAARKRRDEKS